MNTPIYLDHAATSPVDPRVIAAMMTVLGPDSGCGNPASVQHPEGQRAALVVERARAQVAQLIHADPREIVWTSGATESNNLALKGSAEFYRERGRHLVSALTEHASVRDCLTALETEGFVVTRLAPASDGRVHPEQLAAALQSDTVLVSLMHVNNETGIIQDIAALGEVCRARGVRFHVDAAQSAGRLSIDVQTLPVDYLSLSAHKLYGPQGIGALYVRNRPRAGLLSQMHGGGQERGRRSGTLATHQIVGMGMATALIAEEREAEQARLDSLMTRLQQALADLPDLVWIGAQAPRVPNIVNLVVQGVAGESLLASLWDQVSASAGSACTAAEGEPSAILQALGLDPVTAQGAVRLSPGRWTSTAEIDRAGAVLRRTIQRLRRVALGQSVEDLPGPAALPPMYGPTITAWFRQLHGVGRLAPGPGVVTGEAGSQRLGRWIRWDLALGDGHIKTARFSAWGCPATLAVAAWTAQWLEGHDLASAMALTGAQMAEAVSLDGAQRSVALTVEDALRAALVVDNHKLTGAQSMRGSGCPI